MTFNLHDCDCRSVEYDPSGNHFISSSFDETSVVYDIKRSKIAQRIEAHSDRVVLAKWHPFFPIIATTSADSTFKVMASENFLRKYE